MSVESIMKIAIEPLEFEEFNLLDVLVNQEVGEWAFQMRTSPTERAERLLQRLRSIRAKIDRARPPGYAAAIRAARAETVCDT